jgi:two-component system, OmpR family, KDP operon response regulator KdpE
MQSMTNVLVIDDEAQIRRFLRAGFELHGYTVIEAEDATAGLKAAIVDKPNIIVLDLNLPDVEGSEVLERIRFWSNVPVIVLTIHADENEKVRLLRLGADDYVVKPFGITELLARCEASLRRQLRGSNKDPVVRAGPLSIDLVTRTVTLQGRRVQLTRKEQQLLLALATHAGLVVTHQQLLWDIWRTHASNIQYLRILVRKLREKIEPDATRPRLIVSESGIGYRLDTGLDGGAGGEVEIWLDRAPSAKAWA